MDYRKAQNILNILYAVGYFIGFAGGMAVVLLLIAKLFGLF